MMRETVGGKKIGGGDGGSAHRTNQRGTVARINNCGNANTSGRSKKVTK